MGRKLMQKKKTPVRKPWTKDDVPELRAHSKAKTPVAQVAKALKTHGDGGSAKGAGDWDRAWPPAVDGLPHTDPGADEIIA